MFTHDRISHTPLENSMVIVTAHALCRSTAHYVGQLHTM